VSGDYPTISRSVPIYNVLIDYVEDQCDEKVKGKRPKAKSAKSGVWRSDVIVAAAKAAKDKLCQYYSMTDGLTYTCATSKFEIASTHLLFITQYCAFTVTVLDPTLKKAYYVNSEWEQNIIDEAVGRFEEAYHSEYAPKPAGQSQEVSEDNDDPFNSLYNKRRKIDSPDELKRYMDSEPMMMTDDPNQSLLWWKVNMMWRPSS
jgi:hypothetical protein